MPNHYKKYLMPMIITKLIFLVPKTHMTDKSVKEQLFYTKCKKAKVTARNILLSYCRLNRKKDSFLITDLRMFTTLLRNVQHLDWKAFKTRTWLILHPFYSVSWVFSSWQNINNLNQPYFCSHLIIYNNFLKQSIWYYQSTTKVHVIQDISFGAFGF